MVLDTVDIVKTAIQKGGQVYLIVNNRAAGNAPLAAKEIARQILASS
jgi:hypothetical protein